MKTLQLNIPLGYVVAQKKELFEIDAAVKALKSRKRRKYISANRLNGGEYVELHMDIWKCPYCYQELPIMSAMRGYSVAKQDIEKWGTQQLSFFSKEADTLLLNPMPTITGEQACPKCGRVSSPSSAQRAVEILYDKQHIILKAEVFDVREVLAVPWNGSFSLSFPICEVVTFDLDAGHTYIELRGKDATPLAKLDITEELDAWKGSILYRLIRDNVAVSRAIQRVFTEVIGKLPYRKLELSPDRFIIITRFIGYPRNFYDAIPYAQGGYHIEETFIEIAAKLHRAEDAVLMFFDSDLPKCKSLKKIFCGTMGLFFYLDECEELWWIVRDLSLFSEILKNNSIFNILSTLHQRPILFEFLIDFANTKGAKAMIALLLEFEHSIRYAVNYCTMNDVLRQVEKEKWKKNIRSLFASDDEDWLAFRSVNTVPFSIPKPVPNKSIVDCKIDGFSFQWLRSTQEYVSAGDALINCLNQWSINNPNPVLAVYRNYEIVAAIEVADFGVLQAQAHRNADLSTVPGLLEAYRKWKARFDYDDLFDVIDIDDII